MVACKLPVGGVDTISVTSYETENDPNYVFSRELTKFRSVFCVTQLTALPPVSQGGLLVSSGVSQKVTMRSIRHQNWRERLSPKQV